MVAEILEQSAICDGFDIRVQLDSGEVRACHLLTLPKSPEALQAIIDTWAANLPADEPMLPPDMLVVVQDTPIETAFKTQRDSAKLSAIGYLYSHPDCTEADVVAAAASGAPMLNGAYLLGLYVAGAYEQGLIQEPTFEAFKAFVLARTPEELMAI